MLIWEKAGIKLHRFSEYSNFVCVWVEIISKKRREKTGEKKKHSEMARDSGQHVAS